MTTLSEVLNQLKKQGYTEDFNLHENCLKSQGNMVQVSPMSLWWTGTTGLRDFPTRPMKPWSTPTHPPSTT